MDYLLLSRLVFFTTCGIIAGWNVRKAIQTGKWPTFGFRVTRDEAPVAYWACVGLGIVLTVAAVVLIASLLIQALLD